MTQAIETPAAATPDVAPPPAAAESAAAPPPKPNVEDLIKFLPDDDDAGAAAAPAKPADEPAKPKRTIVDADDVMPEHLTKKQMNERFIQLRQQERAAAARQARLEAEREQVLAARKEWEAMQEERKAMQEDPGKYLEWYAKEKGVSVQEAFKRITHRLAKGEAPPEEAPVNKDVAELKAKLAALEAEREQARQQAAQAQFKSKLTSDIAAIADELPYLAAYEPAEIADHVFQVIAANYSQTGKVLDAQVVLRDLHDRQKERFEKDRAAIERRLGSRNQPVTAGRDPGSRTQSAAQSASPRGVEREAARPIPNGVANQRPTVVDLNDPEERMRRAMEAIQFIEQDD